MAININTVLMSKYALLLSKFPVEYRDKLTIYTGEELYYIYQLCVYVGKQDKNGMYTGRDLLFMSLKAKFFRYLKSELNEYRQMFRPLSPFVWLKLNKKWKNSFELWNEEQGQVVSQATSEELKTLREKFNSYKIA